ncbi:MAG: thrombospondin type 3 repeat-containing protein [Pseudomonadales bacterium]
MSNRNQLKRILLALLPILVVYGCGDSSGGTSVTGVTITQPDPTTTVTGGAVKGPLVNANASLFIVDLNAADLKGSLIASGSTNNAAALEGLTIPAQSQDTYLLELTATDSTVDLNSNAAPILTSYQTIVSGEQLRSGDVYATPITSLAISIALGSAPFASMAELNDALTSGARQVISSLGFGLDQNTNPFTSNPLLTNQDTSDDQQRAVLAYRLAIEGLGAVLQSISSAATNAGNSTNPDSVLTAIANDLSDGAIDGIANGNPIESLSGVNNLAELVAADPATLLIPGTDKPITEVSDLIVAETSTTGAVVTTEGFTSGSVSVTPIAAATESDIDGDGTPDVRDAFPNDPDETVDSDGDGTGNNADEDDDGDGTADIADAFPLDQNEQLDTDTDGIGNNADEDDDDDGVPDAQDALPLVASESVDTDLDGIGNNADDDDDGDGVADAEDAFPLISGEQFDSDLDGVGNNADDDDDNDGIADIDDALPLNPRGSNASSATIGPEGGSVTSLDGNLTLTFPANALSTDTLISIGVPTQTATNELDAEAFPIEGHYLLEPGGTQFAEPVQMVWTIPPENNQPGAIRLVYSLSNGIGDAPDEPVINNLQAGTVTAELQHFSDLFIVNSNGLIAINQPTAGRGETLTWSYNFDLQNYDYIGFFRTEGAFLLNEEPPEAGITRQPELLIGDQIIDTPTHETVIHCEFIFDEGDDDLTFDCAPSTTGTITATCLDSSPEGLTSRIGFNFEFDPNLFAYVLFPKARTKLRVEANGTCIDSVEVTEPQFIAVGNDVERITETPDRLIIEECSTEPSAYYITVSSTQTQILNRSGSCSRNLNYDASTQAIFGAELLVNGTESRLLRYGESGVFTVLPVEGVFGELSDFQSTTTDVQHAVDDTGAQIDSQAFSVTTSGAVRLRTLNADGTTSSENPFNAFSLVASSFIGYAPISSTTGIGIKSAATSEAYYVYHGSDTPTAISIGTPGDTALGIACTRLSCDSQSTNCVLGNTDTAGCAVTAFASEELYKVYLDGDLNLPATPNINFTVPIPGIKTASPFVRSNADGRLVTATVNENEFGKVRLEVSNPDGTIVQTAEFFLQDFDTITNFTAQGSSIVLIEPSAEFPNGAVRIGVRESNGDGDGVLTIPVSEALLETSPEPFFGAKFE